MLVDGAPPASPADIAPQSLPAVSNGYLGALPWSSSLFVAGLYSGRSFTTPSHRARIPPPTAFNVSAPGLSLCATALDLASGTFTARYTWDTGPSRIVEMAMLAPRTARHALVTSLRAVDPSAPGTVPLPAPDSDNGLIINLIDNSGPPSIDLLPLAPSGGDGRWAAPPELCPSLLVAQINETETESSPRTRVAVCSSAVPPTISWNDLASAPGGVVGFYTVAALSLEFPGSDAQLVAEAASLAKGLVAGGDGWVAAVGEANLAAWASLWASDIVVDGDAVLDTSIRASLFAIYAAIHDDWPWAPTPTGLVWNGYDSSVFWDNGFWMMPNLMVLNPELAAHTGLAYRLARIGAAEAKAAGYGFEGIMFPWQSCFTGVETTPYPPNIEGRYEQHISGDIALTFRLYWWTTLDAGFMKEPPVLDLLVGVATFWESRLQRVPSAPDLFGVYEVQPPDESAGIVNNSVYTNAVAGQAMEFAYQMAHELGQPERASPLWANISGSMYQPFDAQLGIHLEYEGYSGEDINQADVALLQYPLGLAMSRQVAVRDLEYYSARTRQNGYFTGDSSYSNAWLRLGNVSAAEPMYQAAFAHLAPPFLVWQEKLQGGHANFITGAGGFLQNILFGYLGLDVYGPGQARVTPRLPPAATRPTQPATHTSNSDGATAITFKQLRLGSVAFALTYTSTSASVTWLPVSASASSLVVLTSQGGPLGTVSASTPVLKIDLGQEPTFQLRWA